MRPYRTTIESAPNKTNYSAIECTYIRPFITTIYKPYSEPISAALGSTYHASLTTTYRRTDSPAVHTTYDFTLGATYQ
jgi:hypothetical protein